MEQEKQPEPSPKGGQPDYNTVFQQLVDKADPDKQLIGLVAYGLYKLAKREWVLDYRNEHGQKPTDQEHRQYAKIQTATILDGYRSQATELVATYASNILEEERPKILKAALKGSFWRSFWPSFWSSVFFALILVALGILLAWNGVSLPVKFDFGENTAHTQPTPNRS